LSREKANSIAAKYLDNLSKKQENGEWETVVKMLRKSADTQLRSNIVVETDGGQGEELHGFPDNPKICIFKMRVIAVARAG
jgi:hypothetical protein